MNNSKQRNIILEVINNSFNHPNAYEIYEEVKKQIPNISLGTIYRNLNLLCEKKMIRKIISNDDVDHYDKIFNNHNHFICDKCHKIYDLDNIISYKKKIDGHQILDYDFIFNGICRNCLKKEEI